MLLHCSSSCGRGLWQLIQDAPSDQLISSPGTEYETEDLCAISLSAVNGQEAVRTIRFLGKLNNTQAIILADSGSSGSFISERMAAKFSKWTKLTTPIQVKVANGQILTCTHEISDCKLWIQDHCFTTSLRILPLKCYDVILGIDWLELHSPMEVHWKLKWMSFLHNDKKVILQGIQPDLSSCELIEFSEVENKDARTR